MTKEFKLRYRPHNTLPLQPTMRRWRHNVQRLPQALRQALAADHPLGNRVGEASLTTLAKTPTCKDLTR